jgi:nicotinamide-nucleotide amidase
LTDPAGDASPPHPVAVACLDALRARGETVCTAESLTAGIVCATLATVPGASDCLRGGIAAYATDVKSSVLGVDPGLIDRHGVVSAECAEAMAHAARRLFRSDWAIATTGVAGPTEQERKPVGTVFVALAGPADQAAGDGLTLTGGRDQVRRGAAEAALSLLLAVVHADAAESAPGSPKPPSEQG